MNKTPVYPPGNASPIQAMLKSARGLLQAEKLDQAGAICHAILKSAPQHFDALHLLGVIEEKKGHFDKALECLDQALRLNSSNAEAKKNRQIVVLKFNQQQIQIAAALHRHGEFARAEAIYLAILERDHNNFNALQLLGTIAAQREQHTLAIEYLDRALAIRSDHAEPYNNRGNSLRELNRPDDALASYDRALAIKPDYAEAHYNRGNALQDLKRLDDALASYDRALAIKPDYADAHNNRGNVLKDIGRFDDAVASFRRGLALKPDFHGAYSNLLFVHNYRADQPPEMLLSEAQNYGALVARQARPFAAWPNVPDPGRRLRVGFVSGDFGIHPVGLFVDSVLTALAADASDRMEFFAYPSHIRTDSLAERIQACFHRWHSAVGLSDESLAKQVRDDGIDILIDLSGHTAHNRLPMFAWKPAPVQITWLGYLGTTGVAAIDYLIADSWTIPQSQAANFTEEIWYLPESYLCFTPPDGDAPVSPLPLLTNGYITFGSFNNLAKINDAVVALWARVLDSVPDSRLLLKATQLTDASIRHRVLERFAAHGIAAKRLILQQHLPQAQYLASHQQVDIALDPFPYPGITTTVENLWMGVPVLTLAGDRFVSRQGVGLLMNVGLPDWIAGDPDDYVSRAVLHAGDTQRLAALRNRLRQQVLASPIFDAPRFARHFETALRGMWTRWCDQQQGLSPVPRISGARPPANTASATVCPARNHE